MDDLFAGTDHAPAQAAITTPELTSRHEAGVMVYKDHSEPMSLQDFGEWLAGNTGGGWREALRQAAFMLCCDVIAQDIGKSTLRLRRRMSPKTSEIVMPNKHPIAALLAKEPNRWHTWQEFSEMQVLWHCIAQNAYAGVRRTITGDIIELLPFRSDGQVQPKIANRRLFYDVYANTVYDDARMGAGHLLFSDEDMIHVRGRLLDGFDGYSTLIAGADTLKAAKSINKFRQALFDEEGQGRGVFQRDSSDPLPTEIFERVRSQYKVMMNKFRQMVEPIVLEGGLKFESISADPKDMELVAEFGQQILEQCRLLRVPPHKVFQLEGIKYENLETQEKMYVGDTLVPVAERHEGRYSKILLSEKDRLEYFFEYDRDEMTLRDPKNETERVIRAAERGLIEVDEARAVFGWNALPGGHGQVRLVPVNMSVIDRDGEVVVQGAAGKTDDKPSDEKTPAEPAKATTASVVKLVASK